MVSLFFCSSWLIFCIFIHVFYTTRICTTRIIFYMEPTNKPFSLRQRLKSFVFAGRGIVSFFASEHNALVHLLATVCVVFMGFWLSISDIHWALVVLAIAMVFVAEIFNTAIEKLADEQTREYSPRIKIIKDLSAAAVLITAVGAAIVGLIVFLPPLIDKF